MYFPSVDSDAIAVQIPQIDQKSDFNLFPSAFVSVVSPLLGRARAGRHLGPRPSSPSCSSRRVTLTGFQPVWITRILNTLNPLTPPNHKKRTYK